MSKNGSTVSLEDLVEIQPGYQHRGQMVNEPSGNLNVLQVQDLDHEARTVKPEGIWKMKTSKAFDNYQVSSDDILYLSRGSKFGAYHLPKITSPTIPLAHFFILRPRKDAPVSPTYLWWILNDKKVASRIQAEMKGTMMPFISRAELSKMEIPVPPVEIQELVVKVALLRQKEKDLVQAIEHQKDKIFDFALQRKIFGERHE